MAIHCNRRWVYTDTLHTSFSTAQCTRLILCMLTTWLKTSYRMCPCSAHSCHSHAMVDCFSLLTCSSLCSFPCVSPSPCSSLPTSTCTLSWTSSSMWTTPRQTYLASPPIEESCSLAEYTPPTVFERVCFPDVWAWATHVNFPGRFCGCFAGTLSFRGACSLKGTSRSRSRSSRPSSSDPNGAACFFSFYCKML